jgi:hypothetical protein
MKIKSKVRFCKLIYIAAGFVVARIAVQFFRPQLTNPPVTLLINPGWHCRRSLCRKRYSAAFALPDSCSRQTLLNMFFQNPYLGLASRHLRVLSPLWIAVCAMVLASIGCAHKAMTRLTEVEVAKPVRRDVPVYSEWIGTTVGYIDAQIHSRVTGLSEAPRSWREWTCLKFEAETMMAKSLVAYDTGFSTRF